MFLFVVFLQLLASGSTQEETITGIVYCDNSFSFYVNGELVREDPVPTAPHNAVNVSFLVESGRDIVFAIEARDLADSETGLELENRCIGGGGLRAVFSNGVVTNSSWVCTNHHYGPVNWRECFGAQMVRNQSLQLAPNCFADGTPPLVGCTSRVTPKPDGWTGVDFDDSRWEYALEYPDEEVGWKVRPPGCTEPGTIVSSELDPEGNPYLCPEYQDWGASKFIWRPDLNLDNTILCRYTLRLEDSSAVLPTASLFSIILAVAASIAFLLLAP